MSTLSKYIGDTDIIARFRVRQLRVAVLAVIITQPSLLETAVWILCLSACLPLLRVFLN